MNDFGNKLKNPARVNELAPAETLKKSGLGDNDVFCDIGAGVGVFTIPAAMITRNTVYALDINDESLEVVRSITEKEKLKNVKALHIKNYPYNIPDGSVDYVLLCTVFHEIDDKDSLLSEIKRVVKKDRRLVVIEFHKRKTPMGPPVAKRIAKNEVSIFASNYGFKKVQYFKLGDNFYCLILQKIT